MFTSFKSNKLKTDLKNFLEVIDKNHFDHDTFDIPNTVDRGDLS